MSVYIGNDVVDLGSEYARDKSRDHRFVGKILSDNEQEIFSKSHDPDTLLWSFWAAKESAYKALARHDPFISIAPKNYEITWCHSSNLNVMTGIVRTGIVRTPTRKLTVFSYHDREKVCCLCLSHHVPTASVLVMGVHRLDVNNVEYGVTTSAQSRFIRDKARLSIADYTDNPLHHISIIKPSHQDAPLVTIHKKLSNIVLTLSHDGRFTFYAWFLGKKSDACKLSTIPARKVSTVQPAQNHHL
ncbi:MAG: 4'-phosphopantetheinyl transferase superfamily protein [Desulfobacteraceae bacterium]|jgi:phosphopantetheinyl transferase (holo-ACP synthase)